VNLRQRGSINFIAKWFKLEILVQARLVTRVSRIAKRAAACGVCAQLSTNQLTMHAADISAESGNREYIRMHECTRNGIADVRDFAKLTVCLSYLRRECNRHRLD